MSKLNRLGSIREIAEQKVDEAFARRIEALIGPVATLHARKRALAAADLIEDKADQVAILARAAEQDTDVMALDASRRGIKAKIRAATTSDEIKAIIDTMR